MKKIFLYVLDVLFIVCISVLAVNLVFKDQDLGEMLADLDKANKLWLLGGAVLSVLFVAGEAVIIKYLLRLFRVKIPLRRCLKYSFVGFFYSYITPSASGGQPAQMYYMKKDGICLGHSSLIMVVITLTFKAVLVVMGAALLLLHPLTVIDNTGEYFWLLLLGFGLNLAYISALLFLLIRPALACRLMNGAVKLLCRLHLIKSSKRDAYMEKVRRLEKTYTDGAKYIKSHYKAVINVFVITCAQRLFYFAVTWVVYKSYGLSGTSFLSLITMQVMIAVSVEMLPLPGAAGITEACFLVMQGAAFGESLVRPGMLLSRGLTFYVILIIGALVTLGAHVVTVKKHSRTEDESKNKNEELAA